MDRHAPRRTGFSLRGALLLASIVLALGATPARGAFPGSDGPIAFERYPASSAGASADIFSLGPQDAVPIARAATAEDERQPAYSPDGTRIAFTAIPLGSPAPRPGEVSAYTEIYVMDANGASRTRLTTNEARDQDPAFSADGERLAFSRYRPDGTYEIYTIDAEDGGYQSRLTDDPAFDFDPTFSPGGAKIAFSSNRTGNYEIFIMNADGTGVTQLTHSPGTEFQPDFSPDGRRIAFTWSAGDNSEIYAVKIDGTGLIRLTDSSEAEAWPSFSPDGRKIAYAIFADHGVTRDYELATMNADGTGRQTRLVAPGVDDAALSWGPRPGTAPQCFDRHDNDGDGRVDSADPGCDSPADASESPDPSQGATGGPGGAAGSGQGSTLTAVRTPASEPWLERERLRAAALRGCLRRARLGRRTGRRYRSARRRCVARHGRTPGRVSALTARALSPARTRLGFRAAGTDGGHPPPARSYVVKQALRPIRGRRAFRRARSVCQGPCRFKVSRVGAELTVTATNLRRNATHYYAVAARDNVSGRLGPRSRARRR